MDIGTQISLSFRGVDFPKVEFTSIRPYLEAEHKSIPITIDIKPKVLRPKKKMAKDFGIVMDVTIYAQEHFVIHVVGVGSFKIKGEVDAEKRDSFINTNAPAIMFPYIRSFISNLTSSVGTTLIGTINIPPQFFRGELDVLEDLDEIDPNETIEEQ